MHRRPGYRAVVLLSVISLAALAALVRAGLTHDGDVAITRALQAMASGPLDLAANLHTLVGLAIPTSLAACALSIALFRRGHGTASLAPLLIVGTAAVELALKLTTGHASPGPEFDRSYIDAIGPTFTTPSSFPSGHTARLTFLAAFAALLISRRNAALVAAAFVAFTLVARVYIGDHWPTDVIGGAALGLAFAVPAAAWMRSARSSRRIR